MYKHIGILLITLASTQAFGAEGGGHHDEGIPWGLIQKQAFNFLLVAGLLAYILRAKVRDYFSSRVQNFEQMALLAKKAKREAEAQKQEMKSRLEKLEETAAKSIEQARQEAQQLHAKTEAEAKVLANQIREEAAETVNREVARAKQELQDEVLALSMAQAREHMKTSVKEMDQKRLQNEFVDKIQVVR